MMLGGLESGLDVEEVMKGLGGQGVLFLTGSSY